MEKVWIARVKDGSQFDKVLSERAFLQKAACDDWAALEHSLRVRETEPFYKASIYIDVETIDLAR